MTTEQTLLLNNLMYMPSDAPYQSLNRFGSGNQSVADWINSIDISRIKDTDSYAGFTTGKDWKDIINAVKQDDTLMNLTIKETHTDTASGGGDGRSAVFVSDATQEAIVVFKGTEGAGEWTDNFLGGNVTDTPQQQNALEWYQEVYRKYGLEDYDITVSGHSKGGNKAKYITIMDETINHCVSFDGQGFSDKFMEEYADNIAVRQNVIENHNVDYDFVNILLNDVGDTTYYHGYDYGEGKFLENHCANTFMKFNEDGSFSMHVNPDGQAPEMKALDEFLNSLIRSMPDDKRSDALDLVGEIIKNAFAFEEGTSLSDISNFYFDMAADPKYSDDLAYLVAYMIKYEQENTEFANQISQVLKEFDMEEYIKWIDMIDGLLNFEFDAGIFGIIDISTLLGLVDSLANLPDWIFDIIRIFIKSEWGIELTNEQLRNLLHIFGMVEEDLRIIEIKDNGADIRIDSAAGTGSSGSCQIQITLPTLREASSDIHNIANSLIQIGAMVGGEAKNLGFSLSGASNIRKRLITAGSFLSRLSEETDRMSEALTNIAAAYEKAENNIIINVEARCLL